MANEKEVEQTMKHEAEKRLVEVFGRQLLVSENGQVFNIKTGEELKKYTNPVTGYMTIGVWNKELKKQRTILVHRLVAMAFIPNPDNLPQVNHRNHRRDDNRKQNLEWTYRKLNNSTKHSIRLRSKNHKVTKHGDKYVLAEKDGEFRLYINVNRAARGIGCSEPTAIRAVHSPDGKNWTAFGWRLSFIDRNDPRCAELREQHRLEIKNRKNFWKSTKKKMLERGNGDERRRVVNEIGKLIRRLHFLEKKSRKGPGGSLELKLLKFNQEYPKIADDLGNIYMNTNSATNDCKLGGRLYIAMRKTLGAAMGEEWVSVGGRMYKFVVNLSELKESLISRIEAIEQSTTETSHDDIH